jgi:predicted DNA-binding antitoxin AbrB/MazE fold protein
MMEVVEAVYKNGAFVPEKSFDFPEGARVKIMIDASPSNNESELSASEKSKRLRELVEQMQKNPIPLNAPRFSREELYDRR